MRKFIEIFEENADKNSLVEFIAHEHLKGWNNFIKRGGDKEKYGKISAPISNFHPLTSIINDIYENNYYFEKYGKILMKAASPSSRKKLQEAVINEIKAVLSQEGQRYQMGMNFMYPDLSKKAYNIVEESNIPDDAPYEVVDKKTGDIVWRGTYAKRKFAKRLADKKDQEYGAIRFLPRLSKTKQILEYRHGVAKDLSIHANNKKGGNIMRMTPLAKGPRPRNHKHGDILIGDELYKELGALNGVEFEDGKEVRRKNTNPPQTLKMFINLHNQPCAKVIETQ